MGYGFSCSVYDCKILHCFCWPLLCLKRFSALVKPLLVFSENSQGCTVGDLKPVLISFHHVFLSDCSVLNDEMLNLITDEQWEQTDWSSWELDSLPKSSRCISQPTMDPWSSSVTVITPLLCLSYLGLLLTMLLLLFWLLLGMFVTGWDPPGKASSAYPGRYSSVLPQLSRIARLAGNLEVLFSDKHLIKPELFPPSKKDLMAGCLYHFCANIRLQSRSQIVCNYRTELKGRQDSSTYNMKEGHCLSADTKMS